MLTNLEYANGFGFSAWKKPSSDCVNSRSLRTKKKANAAPNSCNGIEQYFIFNFLCIVQSKTASYLQYHRSKRVCYHRISRFVEYFVHFAVAAGVVDCALRSICKIAAGKWDKLRYQIFIILGDIVRWHRHQPIGIVMDATTF